MSAGLCVTCGDGKYTVKQDTDGRLTALRYGEPWRDCCGDGLIYTLAAEVETLRNELIRVTQNTPELLEALKTLLEASRELDQSATHDGLNNCKAITQARAAIRKAEEGGL